ncbi:MAG: response regulator [Chloroflexi bacterium]|nr:response regulator [Chloroflexota bacterium]
MPTWIVVEDESDIHDFIMGMFEIWGIGGMAFSNGMEAIAWLDKLSGRQVKDDLPELALVDIRLPDIPGPEISAKLRDKWGNNITIVLTTAYHLTPEEEEQIINSAQADALMYKPLPLMADLRRILDQIITKRKTLASEFIVVPRDKPNGS